MARSPSSPLSSGWACPPDESVSRISVQEIHPASLVGRPDVAWLLASQRLSLLLLLPGLLGGLLAAPSAAHERHLLSAGYARRAGPPSCPLLSVAYHIHINTYAFFWSKLQHRKCVRTPLAEPEPAPPPRSSLGRVVRRSGTCGEPAFLTQLSQAVQPPSSRPSRPRCPLQYGLQGDCSAGRRASPEQSSDTTAQSVYG